MKTARWSCIVVAILCCLLTSAATAYAECAWVLWQQSMNPPPGAEVWEPFKAYTKSVPCQDDAVMWSKRGLDEAKPDTADPRGPKGK